MHISEAKKGCVGLLLPLGSNVEPLPAMAETKASAGGPNKTKFA